MDNSEILIRHVALLEEVVRRVSGLENRLDVMNNDRLRGLEKEIGDIKTSMGINQDRLSRLEKIIYGTITIIFIQAVAMIFLWLQHK